VAKPTKHKDKFLNNNKDLPIDVQIEYTAEQIEEFKKCKEDIEYFAETYFTIVHPDRGKVKMALYEPQKRAIRKIVENRNTVICASRQVGKTSLMTVVCLWYALFNNNFNIAILANQEKMALEILSRIKTAYKGLPIWLKAGVPVWTQGQVTFSNESNIFASTTSENSIRGQTVNILFLDEFAFVPPEIAEAFFASVVPAISASTKSKMVLVSTPNGTGNKYYELYSEAVSGKNKNGQPTKWAFEKIHWREIPGRSEAWKQDQLAMLGHDMDKWAQEYELTFLNNGQRVFNEELMKRLKLRCIQPTFSFDDGDYILYKEPEPNRIISIGVDTAEGVGQDYSVAYILDITDPFNIIHCGMFASNVMQPFVFAEKLNQIARSWGRPFLCIESNGPGGQVIDAMINTHHYDNIVTHTMKNDKEGRYQKPGIFSHINSKLKGITNMRYFLETLESVNIRDLKTIVEFETFTRKNGNRWGAEKGYTDDRIMALVWGLVILEREIAEKYLDIIELDDAGKVVRIADPNQDLANQLLLEGTKKISYARLGGIPQPTIFQFGGGTSSYGELETAGYAESGFRFL
jgi:Terminase large subunit, T4likevirus-type, N-terminal